MNAEIVTLVVAFFNIIFMLVNSVVLYSLNRRAKKIDIITEEIHELNIKMHDRLVDAQEEIKNEKYPSKKTKKGLLYNASRLIKYDETIVTDVYRLLNSWDSTLFLKERGNITDGKYSESIPKWTKLIEKIKTKVDKLQKN